MLSYFWWDNLNTLVPNLISFQEVKNSNLTLLLSLGLWKPVGRLTLLDNPDEGATCRLPLHSLLDPALNKDPELALNDPQ